MGVLSADDLRKYDFFSSFSDSALEALSWRINVVTLPAGTIIIREGTVGDSFYFVEQGTVEITKTTQSGLKAKISVMGSGEGFGEMALLTCSRRSSSVTAVTDVILYELPRAAFEEIILHESAFAHMLIRKAKGYLQYTRIKTLQPFALLNHDKMFALIDKLKEKKYLPGEKIVVQGEKGDYYYIIRSGRVAVLRKQKGEEEPRPVAFLGAGESFGEEALIRDDPRNATVQATEETTVLMLTKTDFNATLKASFMESVFPEDVETDRRDRYVFIDARIRPEYDEVHIEGAVNIPLEELRGKFGELDPAKEYLTYCTNDARGMVSAFLLKSRGFNAKCLRGGVSAWTGPVASGSDGIYLPSGKSGAGLLR